MKQNKKGAMEISVGAIVILILAIAFLSLGLVFIKGVLGKMFMRFDEQISQEPEPPKPTLSRPITLSRNPIKTPQDEVQVLKINILNPSQDDWLNRQFTRTDNMCGKADGICFREDGCNEANDPDCETGLFTGMSCDDNNKKSPCLMDITDCPCYTEDNCEPDCAPREGVDIYLTCPKEVMEEPFKRNIGIIKTGDYKTNILLLRLKSKVPDDQYLCQIRIFAEEKEYIEDLVVDVKNE